MFIGHASLAFAKAGRPRVPLAVRMAVALLALCLALPRPALACSMCRCSDPVFNALGKGLYTEGGFQVALDWNRLDQSQGEGPDLEIPGSQHRDGDALL